jgi:hypothetical protein
LREKYLRKTAFSEEILDLIFLGEVELNGVFNNFLLLLLPEGRLFEEEVRGFVAIGKDQQIALALQGQPLDIDVLELAVSQILFVVFALNSVACTLK